ncbi:lachesin-like isoform X1 [Mytilus galloprovincialis]|uniref:lachesin-like isoform X1 n=1 Tax=Mytilus galloprovincialis TaxID=29158 RepID=UPI003F7B6A52
MELNILGIFTFGLLMTAIRVAPTKLDIPANKVSSIVGGTVSLRCAVISSDIRTVTWRRKIDTFMYPLSVGRKVYSTDSRLSVKAKHGWALVIKDVTQDDEGEYECQAKSKRSNLKGLFLLKVKENHRSENKHFDVAVKKEKSGRKDPTILGAESRQKGVSSHSYRSFIDILCIIMALFVHLQYMF